MSWSILTTNNINNIINALIIHAGVLFVLLIDQNESETITSS